MIQEQQQALQQDQHGVTDLLFLNANMVTQIVKILPWK